MDKRVISMMVEINKSGKIMFVSEYHSSNKPVHLDETLNSALVWF
jgi:hypothetical protein